jgi:hypothetical protein
LGYIVLAKSGRVLSLALHSREIEHVRSRAVARYVPGHCDCVVLFRASAESKSTANGKNLGWRKYVEGVITVIDLPGNRDRAIEHPELSERLKHPADSHESGHKNGVLLSIEAHLEHECSFRCVTKR